MFSLTYKHFDHILLTPCAYFPMLSVCNIRVFNPLVNRLEKELMSIQLGRHTHAGFPDLLLLTLPVQPICDIRYNILIEDPVKVA